MDHDISSRPASSEMVSCCAECKSVRVCTITGDSWSKGADFTEDHNVEMVMEFSEATKSDCSRHQDGPSGQRFVK